MRKKRNKKSKVVTNIIFNVIGLISTINKTKVSKNLYDNEFYRAMISEGVTVNTMCPMCSNSVVPATAGARLVVSDRGDILSPKYAPDTTAPAVIAGENPRAIPTPIRAAPIDPAVDQDEPVARDTMEQSRQVVNKKILGLMILIP